MSFPRYPKYKDSGVEWLGAVPEHWEVCAVKHLIAMQSGESITGESIHESGPYPVFGGNGLRGYTSDFTHDGRFALIGRQGALCGNVNYGTGKFWASEHAIVATPKKPADTTWLGETLRTMDLNQYSVAAAQPGLSVELVGRIGVAVPPLPEQIHIAAFLDRETAKIDALVAEQQRLIELLKEKRQAVISHAVTKGVNSDAPMKDSGIEWLGEVPAHWEVTKLRYISPQLTVGIVVEPSKFYAEEGVPALRSLNVQPGAIKLENLVFISHEGHGLHSKSRLNAGDLVAVRSGQPGTTAVIPTDLDGCNCIDLIIIRKPTQGSEYFLCWFLASEIAIHQFSVGSGGAIQQHFNVSTASDLIVATPPRGEQDDIVLFLNRETARFDTLTTEAQRAIDLLQERRTALISAAVTGQIDVRANGAHFD